LARVYNLLIFALLIFAFWLLVVIIYPAIISMYVTLPLFIGFSGLMFVLGIEKEKPVYTFLAFLYMLSLEINLSLPILLIAIASMIYYIFILNKLTILKHCRKCIYIITVISINLIYFILLNGYDFITSQNSIDYNYIILYSIIFDIISAVLI